MVKRTSEALPSASSFVSEKYIKKWFKEMSDYIMEKSLEDVINEPTIINTGKVIVCKGDKNVFAVKYGASKKSHDNIFLFGYWQHKPSHTYKRVFELL